jgi:hypothetical protein
MSKRLDATEVQLRDVLSAEANAEAPEMSNIIAMPVRRGRLRLIQGGAHTASSGKEGTSASEEAGFDASVLIGWAADGTHYLEVNCLPGQHLQTLMNAVMELEVVILATQSKQDFSSDAPEIVGPTNAAFSTPCDSEKATHVEPTPPIPEQ